MEQKTIFIVGAGYVGQILCDQFSKRDDVHAIIVLDKESQPDFLKQIPKITYIQHNMADDGWQGKVAQYAPDTVVHTAWQIRAMYGQSDTQWRWNVEGSNKVFDFVFDQSSVTKMIYFSTAASYSARSDNRFDYLFTEEVGLRDDDYIYAKEKKVSEENLAAKFDEAKKEGKVTPQITIVRPAAITGPRGRHIHVRFGLQSALQGNLQKGFINRAVTTLTAFMPATKGWVRQFIHEDDVTDIVALCAFEDVDWEYNVFNITPVSELIYASDMAKAVGKKILPITPAMARFAFFFFWHATRGKIPTCPGSWRFYSYPIVMSGEKLAQVYTCRYSSKDALLYTEGRYKLAIPEKHKF